MSDEHEKSYITAISSTEVIDWTSAANSVKKFDRRCNFINTIQYNKKFVLRTVVDG